MMIVIATGNFNLQILVMFISVGINFFMWKNIFELSWKQAIIRFLYFIVLGLALYIILIIVIAALTIVYLLVSGNMDSFMEQLKNSLGAINGI